MNFLFSEELEALRTAIAKLSAAFDQDYWLARDRDGAFPHDFHQALARDGWLGIAMPQDYGGAGLGITEAAIMMQAIAESGAGFSGASAVHMNIFGLNPVVVFGTAEQKQRWLPPLIAGADSACFAVTVSKCVRSRKWGARQSIPTSCSSTVCAFRWPTASARKAMVSTISCTA